MTDLATALAAPVEFTAVDGQSVKLCPLAMNDLAEMNAWVKSERVKAAQSTGDVQVTMAALREPITVEAVFAEMGTLSGMRQVLWLSIRKGLPDITIEQAANMFGSPEQALAIIMNISGLEGDDSGSDPPAKSQQITAQ